MASTKTESCASWDDFTRLIAQLRGPDKPPLRHLFRGHANAGWMLRSSLGRIAQEARMDESSAVNVEKQLRDNFVEHAHLLLPPSLLADKSDLLHWWTVMQHYRAPTRLLDWTWSPYVALYFASVEEAQKDGAVWAIAESALRRTTSSEWSSLESNPESFFWSTRASAHFAVVGSDRPNERMNAQQGVFTVTNAIVVNHEQFISNLGEPRHENDLVKLEIKADCKIEMLKRLREMNVQGLSLFPGIDGVGATMRALAMILCRP